MDDNQKRFIADTLELLNELDEGLMQLEVNPEASAPLEMVFRTMHTIKGGANMFGFISIGELSHLLESIFELIRSKKIATSDSIISLTLNAYDAVRGELQTLDIDAIFESKKIQKWIETVTDYIANNEEIANSESFITAPVQTYLVRVKPLLKITENGNHPLVYIIQDVETLGDAKKFAYSNKDGDLLQWDVFISTSIQKEEIESNFIFVGNECTYEISLLSSTDLFQEKAFDSILDTLSESPVDIENLKLAISSIVFYQKETTVEDKRKFKKSESVIKVDKEKVDTLLNWISELIIIQSRIKNISNNLSDSALKETTEQLENITFHLRDISLEIGLIPIETLVTKFKRLVRDLSKKLDKKINYISEGTETEMDKDVIEIMDEPMIHILRNCIDHGIETPAERKANGKSEFGTIKLKAFNSGSYINILISDDGKGIDGDAILAKARNLNLISKDVELSEEEKLELIFLPGLSTNTNITDISGRGVGMDVVKNKINELRGSIKLKSIVGKGTSFNIKLPLSRSIIDGLEVKVADTHYIIPMSFIEHIDLVEYKDLDKGNLVLKQHILKGQLIEIYSLREHFHALDSVPLFSNIIALNINGEKKAIAVDKINGKIQTVLKPLGDFYKDQEYLSGSTILGDGTLALVIDPERLFKQ